MIKIKILKIKNSNLSSFVDLWNQNYKLLTSSGWRMNLEKAKEGFKKKMFDYYGAFINNLLLGFILLNKKNKTYWIKHLLVDKNSRNKGVGKKLLNKVINIAKRDKLSLKTEVLKENKIALNFFLKNNFQIEKFDAKEKQFILKYKN